MSVLRPVTDLLDDRLSVPVPGGDAAWREAQRTMARWSNGGDHARRRAIATAALSSIDVGQLRDHARAMAAERIPSATDLTDLARTVPVTVLATALGFGVPCEAARDQRIVLAAIAPEDGATPPPDREVDRAMARLLDASGAAAPEEAANRVALLHQCADATAGLVLGALLCRVDEASAQEPGSERSDALVDRALRTDPPVLHTRREDAAGHAVTVSLAGAPFGAGRHACPGSDHAIALAAGVLDALLDTLLEAGLDARIVTSGWERRDNLRIAKLRLDRAR